MEKIKSIKVESEDLERNRRQTLEGIVVSAGKMDKTIVVAVISNKKHPVYKKIISRTKRFKAHDEENTCALGDKVEIMQTRHLSKDKYFRVVRVIEKAK